MTVIFAVIATTAIPVPMVVNMIVIGICDIGMATRIAAAAVVYNDTCV